MLIHMKTRPARAIAAAAVTALVLVAGACADSTSIGNTLADKAPPSVSLTAGGSTVDTVISFNVEAKDNLGIKTITVNVSGGLSLAFDTTFTLLSLIHI